MGSRIETPVPTGQTGGAILEKNWLTLEDCDFDELLRLSRLYYREAVRCQESKAYVAGCVMAGASLEALLLAMVHMYSSEVEAADLVAKRKHKSKPLLQWSLAELLHAAKGMKWLPVGLPLGRKWISRKAKIGDYAEALRHTRNLVHPARYLMDHSPQRVTKKYLVGSIETLEVSVKYLERIVHKSIREDLEK